MKIRDKFIDVVKKNIGENVTKRLTFKEGEFFDGGEVMVSVKNITPPEARALGLDPLTCGNRLYCEGKFFNDGFEYHFTLLDCGNNNWAIKMFESQVVGDTWEMSTGTYAKFPTSQEIYEKLARCFKADLS